MAVYGYKKGQAPWNTKTSWYWILSRTLCRISRKLRVQILLCYNRNMAKNMGNHERILAIIKSIGGHWAIIGIHSKTYRNHWNIYIYIYIFFFIVFKHFVYISVLFRDSPWTSPILKHGPIFCRSTIKWCSGLVELFQSQKRNADNWKRLISLILRKLLLISRKCN